MRDLVGELVRPVKELIGFQKIHIKAGETKTVTFNISVKDFEYWHLDITKRADKGDFQIWIAPNSAAGEPALLTYQ